MTVKMVCKSVLVCVLVDVYIYGVSKSVNYNDYYILCEV